MYSIIALYFLFSLHYVAMPSPIHRLQPGSPRDGLPGASNHHPQPGSPRDGLPGDAILNHHLQPGSPQDGLPGASNHNHGHELVQPSDARPLGDYDYEEDELTYLVENADFDEVDIETISGNKKDSVWLIINNQYICVKNDESVSGNILQ